MKKHQLHIKSKQIFTLQRYKKKDLFKDEYHPLNPISSYVFRYDMKWNQPRRHDKDIFASKSENCANICTKMH